MRIEAQPRQNLACQRVADPGAEHDDVAVGEVDELQNAVHHRVAQRDQRVQAADFEGRDQRLNEVGHADRQVSGTSVMSSRTGRFGTHRYLRRKNRLS